MVGIVFDVTLTALAVRPPAVFVLSIWLGWLLTIAVAEAWIRQTRQTLAM